MVSIKIKNLDVLQEVTNEDVSCLEFEDEPAINDVLFRMQDVYGKAFSEKILEKKKNVFKYALSVVINDDEIISRSGFNRKLSDNTTITILLPIYGG